MKIAHPPSYTPTRIILSASPDFMLKIKGAPVWFAAAFVDETIDDDAARHLFEEVHTLDVPKYHSIQNLIAKVQDEALASAGIDITATTLETPSIDTPAWIPGELVKKGAVRQHEGIYYESLKTHTTTAALAPGVSPNTWKPIDYAPDNTTWVSNIYYHKDDTVIESGITYKALKQTKNNQPSKSPNYWAVV